MKIAKLSSLAAIVLICAVQGAQALVAPEGARTFTDVCTLANTEVPASIRVSSEELSAYKAKLQAECELSEKYQQMKLKAQKFGITLEQITEYQAIRYVRRDQLNFAKSGNVPVPYIYQLIQADYSKPIELRSSVIWQNFTIGIRQMDVERARLEGGGRIEVSDLERIHRGFYTLADEHGDFSHVPFPGEMKGPSPNDGYWWILNPDDVSRIRLIVSDVNRTFATYGLLPTDAVERYQVELLSVREIGNGRIGIYGGDSRANLTNIRRLLEMLNAAMAQARSGHHMMWNGRLITPGDLAFLSQQFFVDVHPFSEGNGRTSRLLQELILTSFSMPHGASGDLMDNDVLTRQGEYYERAMSTTRALLTSVDNCFENEFPREARANGAKSERSSKGQSATRVVEPINATMLDQSKLDYNCRILPL